VVPAHRTVSEGGMILECRRRRDWRMPVASQDSGRVVGCGVCLETPKRGSWSWSERKKNGMRDLWASGQDVLRPQVISLL